MKCKWMPEDAVRVSEKETSVPLVNFRGKTIPAVIRLSHVDAVICPDLNCLSVTMKSMDNFYTSIFLEPEHAWDWSELPDFCFAFDVKNEGTSSTQIFINIFDHQGQMHSRCVNAGAGQFLTPVIELKGAELKGGLNYESGMRSNPAPWQTDFEYATWMWGQMNLDLTGIARIEIGVHGVLVDHHLQLGNIRLIFSPEPEPDRLKHCVDRYGQNAKVDYPQKIHSDDELARVTRDELESLKAGMMPDRSRYGGFKNGPRFEATGYFRTEKIDGQWTLIDPDGFLYFATGLDVIRLANTSTITGADFAPGTIAERSADDLTPEDSMEKIEMGPDAIASRFIANRARNELFEWLPPVEDPLAAHYSYTRKTFGGPVEHGETFTFYGANLQRKYGADGTTDFMQKWRDVTVDRMLNWGFTSLGNWTASEFYSNGKIPYFANGWVIGDFKTVSSGDDFWGELPDPFDPVFKTRAEATAAQIKKEVQDSPWCVGIYIDNEKSWGRMGTDAGQFGIAVCTLERNAADCPAKAVFTELMKKQYETIDALNAAWETDLASWSVFAGGVKRSGFTEVKKADYSRMLEAFASEYFRVVNEAVKAQLPNHLYLGCRFADWGMTPETVRAAARHVDVISYNYYKEGLHPKAWAWEALEEVDMPSIIGEFHVGAKDSGFFHPGLVSASSQDDRGVKFQEYMKTVIDHPYFVGAHYFQYIDSPVTGRACDGENYNIGFVAITDVPYQPMVDAAKEIHKALYERRYKANGVTE